MFGLALFGKIDIMEEGTTTGGMIVKKTYRLVSLLLITAMLCSLLPGTVRAAGYNLNDGGYTRIGYLPNDFVASQGMAADENYVYSLKTPSGGHNDAIIYRTDIHTGSTIALVNGDNTSTCVLNGLGHGNDMAAVVHNGKTYLYVTTMYHVGHAEYSAHTIWKLEVSGNTVRRVAYYDVNDGKNPINFVALTVHSFENGTVRLLGSVSSMVFYMDIGINQSSGSVRCNYICPLNYNSITVPTGAPGYSGTGYYGVQGMTYNNNRLYFVMTAASNNTYRNKNYIIAYDLSNLADGNTRNNIQGETIYLTSSYYWYFLEIESLDAVNGRLYFTANAGSSGGYYNNEDFVGCFNHIYDTDPEGMLLEFESGSRETKWNWRHYIGSSGASIAPNPTAGNGFLSGTLGVLSSEGQTSTDSFLRMTAFDVLYKIKAGDIMEIAFDYEHISGTAPNSAAIFFTTNTVGYFTPDRMFAGSSHYFRSGRNVLQFGLSSTSGGAVGEFISQFRIDLFDGGSDDFKAKYAIDYIYIGPPQDSPQSKIDYMGNGDFIFMDFVATAPMSANNHWSGNSITALVNHSNGTLNGDIFGGDPFLCTERMPGMKIKEGDILEIRMKTSITSGNAGHLEVFYGTDKTPGYSGERMFTFPIYATGDYQVAYVKLPSNTVGQTLTQIRIDPVSAGATEPLQGSYTIDYIYAGRPNNSPKNKQEHMGGGRFLLADFDKEAPLCETGNWVTHNSVVTGDTAAGVLRGTYKGGDPYAESRGDFLYNIQKGDIVEIRLKSNVTGGTSKNQMEFFFVTYQNPNYGQSGYLTSNFTHNNTFQTIRMNIPDSFAGQTVNGIRIDPLANSLADSLSGTFEIDYIYMGPKDQAPASIYTVTFCDEGGKVLQTLTVSEGEEAAYTGNAPTKASDHSKHFTFAGWVDEVGNIANLKDIQSDLKVYASFLAEGHHFTVEVIQDPTCTAHGTERYFCSCGYSFEESLPTLAHSTKIVNASPSTCSKEGYSGDEVCQDCGAVVKTGQPLPLADHSPVTDPGYEATCTAPGLSEGSHCGICGTVLVEQVTLPVADHDPQIVPGTPADCLRSGLTDGQICGTCGTVLVQQLPIPRLGHSYVYENLGQSHSYACERCGKAKTENHTYTEGSCICGAVEIKDPVVDESITINHTLNLASDISINFALRAELLADYVNHYLVCEIPVYEGNVHTGTRTVTIEPVLKGSFYYYTLTGLTAVQMGDVVSAQLHMEKEGQPYLSKVDTYSVAQYAYSQMNKDVPHSLKALCADLLRYGKEAQIFKAYRTDALVDASMTEAHRAYLSDAEAISFGNNNEVLNDLEKPVITWEGKSLSLDTKVAVKYVFSPGAYEGKVEDLVLRVHYANHNGAVSQTTLTEPVLYNEAMNTYAFTFDGLLAAELRAVTDVAVYAGDTRLSQTLRYSPDTYGNNKTGQLLILCKALFAYSDTAKAYFAG